MFRYYSNAVLDAIHRSMAIEEWSQLQNFFMPHAILQPERKLERALGAFDMFFLHNRLGDLDHVCHHAGLALWLTESALTSLLRYRMCWMRSQQSFSIIR